MKKLVCLTGTKLVQTGWAVCVCVYASCRLLQTSISIWLARQVTKGFIFDYEYS